MHANLLAPNYLYIRGCAVVSTCVCSTQFVSAMRVKTPRPAHTTTVTHFSQLCRQLICILFTSTNKTCRDEKEAHQ